MYYINSEWFFYLVKGKHGYNRGYDENGNYKYAEYFSDDYKKHKINVDIDTLIDKANKILLTPEDHELRIYHIDKITITEFANLNEDEKADDNYSDPYQFDFNDFLNWNAMYTNEEYHKLSISECSELFKTHKKIRSTSYPVIYDEETDEHYPNYQDEQFEHHLKDETIAVLITHDIQYYFYNHTYWDEIHAKKKHRLEQLKNGFNALLSLVDEDIKNEFLDGLKKELIGETKTIAVTTPVIEKSEQKHELDDEYDDTPVFYDGSLDDDFLPDDFYDDEYGKSGKPYVTRQHSYNYDQYEDSGYCGTDDWKYTDEGYTIEGDEHLYKNFRAEGKVCFEYFLY